MSRFPEKVRPPHLRYGKVDLKIRRLELYILRHECLTVSYWPNEPVTASSRWLRFFPEERPPALTAVVSDPIPAPLSPLHTMTCDERARSASRNRLGSRDRWRKNAAGIVCSGGTIPQARLANRHSTDAGHDFALRRASEHWAKPVS
jgi:hypothetical protein